MAAIYSETLNMKTQHCSHKAVKQRILPQIVAIGTSIFHGGILEKLLHLLDIVGFLFNAHHKTHIFGGIQANFDNPYMENLEDILLLLSKLFTFHWVNGNNVGFLIEAILHTSAKCFGSAYHYIG